ncbi:MAG: FG-GAP-like repeat-containing protein, partial [Maribacter sp.]
ISKLDNKTAWYENIDGLGNFGAQQLITNQEAVAMLSLKDIDGDGDNDLLFLSDFEISWLENIDGKGSFSNKRIIASKVTRFFGSFYLADMNNDGFLDIVGTSKGGFNTVFWIQNEDGYGTYGNLIEIDNTARGAKFAETGDMDGDGDLDIVAAIPNNDDILWYENIDGLGTFTKKVVTLNFDNVAIARVVDIDNDSDLDVIAGANYLYGDDIALYENIDGLGTFRLKQIVTNIPKGVVWLDTGDMDGDNDMDILQASFSSDNLVWYENIDGLGEFGKEKMITRIPSIPRSIITVDIDGDGDEDVASTGMDARISWYDNLDGIGTFSPQKIITSGLLQALFITAGDVDQDNDIDLLAIHSSVDSGNILVWYENTDGNGNFDEEKVIKVGLNAHEIHMADMDGDTDMDIVSNSEIAEIVWYENIDGNFSTKHVILPDANAATILPLDIDNDGDIDVAYGVGNATRGEFQWVENIDGNGNFGSFNLISPYEGFIRHMTSIDFDSDGDFDIVGSSNQLKLSENRNGQGRFSHKSTFQTFSSVDESIGADLDGDGNIDVLYISRVDRKIAWYKNLDGTNFSDEMLIFNRSQIGDIEVTDIDNDGDTDIVLTSITDGKISWLENKDNAEPLNLTATLITPNCNVSDSATIQVDVSGGSVPYNYTLLDESGTVTIVPYQTTNLFENLATGQYIIRVMDSNDQVINDSFSVPDSTPIALELLVDKGECLVDPTDGIYKSGRIKIEPTGGIPPYQAYIARTFGGISNPSVSDPLLYEGLGQGIYEVTVIDAGGCSVFETVQISDSSCAPAELQFTTSIEVNEGSQSLTVPFELSGEINGGFTVDYTINALTAENTTDFDGTNGTLTFAGTDEEIQNITISIIDDNAIEANESFNIVLSNQSSTDVLLLEDTVIATISDNDLIPGSSGISFETSNIVVDEDAEFATLNVTLVGNVQESFTIDYSTVDNDAQSVEDYIPTSGSLTFAGFNGELQQISIPIVNDNIAEIQENFSVSLSNISTTLIPIIENIATVAIKDNTIATPLSITNWELSVITCNGANDASILVNVSGGTPPYSFSLQDQMGNTIVDAHNTNYFENLSSGDYYISVEDATNETTTGTLINISEPTIISASYTIG